MSKGTIDPMILDASGEDIYAVIKAENPQVQAMALALLTVAQAGAVLKLFPIAIASDLLQRLAKFDQADSQINPQSLQDLRDFLSAGLKKVQLAGMSKKIGGSKQVAQILAEMNDDHAKPVMVDLQQAQPELWQAIDQAMFGFAVLRRVERKDLITFLATVADPMLVLVLKNIEADIKEKILTALSARRRLQIEDDMQEKRRVADVTKAQRDFLQLLKQAIEKGTVKLLAVGDRWV